MKLGELINQRTQLEKDLKNLGAEEKEIRVNTSNKLFDLFKSNFKSFKFDFIEIGSCEKEEYTLFFGEKILISYKNSEKKDEEKKRLLEIEFSSNSINRIELNQCRIDFKENYYTFILEFILELKDLINKNSNIFNKMEVVLKDAYEINSKIFKIWKEIQDCTDKKEEILKGALKESFNSKIKTCKFIKIFDVSYFKEELINENGLIYIKDFYKDHIILKDDSIISCKDLERLYLANQIELI